MRMNDTGTMLEAFGNGSAPITSVFCKQTLFGNMDLAQSDLHPAEDIDQVYDSCDQILPMLSSVQDPSTDLFALIQQHQLDDADTTVLEEQRIDAQIERLLQLKAQMQAAKQAQQPVILENAPYQTASFTSRAVSSGLTSMSPSVAMDNSLLAPAAFIEVSQEWPWMSGGNGSIAARPARHSIDLGGLAARMTACDLNSKLQHHSFNVPGAGTNLSNSFTLQGAEQQQVLAAGLPAAVSFGSAAPLAPAGLVDMPAVTAAVPALNNMHLQSALFVSAQLPGSNLPSFEAPLPATTSMLASQVPATGRTPGQRRMSLDLSRLQAYGGQLQAAGPAYTAATVGSFQSFDSLGVSAAAGMGTHACWSGGFNPTGCATISVLPQRASIDLPILATPDNRCPPRMTPTGSNGSSSGSSARNSPISNPQQQHAQQQANGTADISAAAKGSGVQRHQPPLHQAPKWAGSHWNPMSDVVRNGTSAVKGTGVFIPGGGVPKLAEGAKA